MQFDLYSVKSVSGTMYRSWGVVITNIVSNENGFPSSVSLDPSSAPAPTLLMDELLGAICSVVQVEVVNAVIQFNTQQPLLPASAKVPEVSTGIVRIPVEE